MAGGRAAGGRRRRGAAAGRRRACAELPRVCPVPPPPSPQSLHGAVRCGALPSSALLCTALLQSLHRAAPPPLSLHHAAFFPSLHAPLPPPAFSGCRALLRSSPPGRCLALALLQTRALLPSHSVAPSNHCNAFKRSSTPFLPPGTAPQDPSEHCPTCQAPHCLTAPLTPLHCTALHLPPAETAPNLAVTAAATLHHASLLASGCTPTATPQCTASPFDCCTTHPPSTARNSL